MIDFVTRCYEAKVQVFDFSMIMRKAHSDQEMEAGYKEVETNEVSYIAVGALVPADFEKEFLSGLELFSQKAQNISFKKEPQSPRFFLFINLLCNVQLR